MNHIAMHHLREFQLVSSGAVAVQNHLAIGEVSVADCRPIALPNGAWPWRALLVFPDVHLVDLHVLPLATLGNGLFLAYHIAGPGDIQVGVDALHGLVARVQKQVGGLTWDTGHSAIQGGRLVIERSN